VSRWVMSHNGSHNGRSETETGSEGAAITFLARLQSSEQFDVLFKDGMALVERTATYLDGPGRKDCKGLKPAITVLYASESMRLTTRLLDIASWLLIRRALKQGEIGENEARMKRQSLKLQSLGRPSHVKGFDDLPPVLRGLVEESFNVLDRVTRLDRALAQVAVSEPVTAQDNPVGAQMLRLRRAFGQ
jgi:regulator of CtrA degradation